MCSLNSFPAPPPRGHVTLCEVDGHLLAAPSSGPDISNYTNKIAAYPAFQVQRDVQRPSSARESVQTAFLPGRENVWKRAITAWYDHGLINALEELTGNKARRAVGLVSFLPRIVLKYLQWLRSLHSSFYPHLILSNEDLIEEFSTQTDWKQGKIRAFAWHPHVIKFAIALHDDSVKILIANNRLSPILKYREQRGICDLSWRPYSASTLAVACLSGIAVWNVDPTSVVTRLSATYVQWLSYPGHSPVTCVQWDPRGKLLLSSSPRDSTMIIWDVASLASVPLRCVRGGGVSLIRWSPDGQRVFVATPTTTFRVWETHTWTNDSWFGSGRCHAACWSPDGNILLTSMRDEPLVYSVTFSNAPSGSGDLVGGSKMALPVIDLSPVILQAGDEHLSIGGNAQLMEWDKSGKRLAICFNRKDSRQELIAVFRTKTKPTLDISPCGFIRGRPGDVPQHFAFQDGFEGGALLTVCWSSGEISHIPFLFPTSSSPWEDNMISGHTAQNVYASPRMLYSALSPIGSL